MTQEQMNRKLASYGSLQKLLTSPIKLAIALLLISLVALPYVSATSSSIPNATNVWPSAVTVNFNQFSTATQSDGTRALNVAASVNINTMSVPSDLMGPVIGSPGSEYYQQWMIKQGARIVWWDIKLYVVSSDGTPVLAAWISDIGRLNQPAPGTYTLADDGTNRWGGGYTGQGGVYAFVVVYCVVQSTEILGSAPGATGITGLRVLVSGIGTAPQ